MDLGFLIIDDNEELASLIQEELNRMFGDVEIKCASNKKDAIEYLEAHTPSLVITDVLIAPSHALQVLLPFFKDDQTINFPIVFMTGLFPDAEELKPITEMGYPIIFKPFHLQDLVETIRNAVEEFNKNRQNPLRKIHTP